MPRRKKNVVPDIIKVLSKQMIPTTAKYNSKGVAIGITSIMGVKYDSMEEATKVASSISGIPLNPPKRRASSVMKDVNRYKHPLFPPIKQTIKVVSKTGKTYYRTILTQDVALEHAYRSMVWQWNKAKREGNPDVRGRISSSGIQEYYTRHGRFNTLTYIRQLEYRAKKKVASVGSLAIIGDLLDEVARTDPSLAPKVQELKERLQKDFASEKGIDVYDMKETRQGIYEDSPSADEILERIEKFLERQEKSNTRLTTKNVRLYV